MSSNLANEAFTDMLNAFASVGTFAFDITFTDLAGDKVRFRRSVPLDAMRESFPRQIETASRQQHNVIARPCPAKHITLIQLDDLDARAMEAANPASFVVLQTSPGNFQAWVAVSAPADPDLPRRLRKGAMADPTASGATRVAGSLNFKEKYAPNFPLVTVAHVQPGHVVTAERLRALGLVAEPEAAAPALPRVSPSRPCRRKWPNYLRCVEGAPPNHGNTGPDVSRADFTWCMTAITWGWTIEETADRLLELSAKAAQNGELYAARTAQNAAAAVERRTSARR